MNKSEFIDAVASSAEMTKADTEKCVWSVLATITAELVRGGQVVLPGFGTFSVVERAAREGRNPQTGATIKIAATKAAKFKVGKGLKDACKDSYEGSKE
ncbi:MAG: HU family DNA-binding protein [Gammaproteobacteria bacterium]